MSVLSPLWDWPSAGGLFTSSLALWSLWISIELNFFPRPIVRYDLWRIGFLTFVGHSRRLSGTFGASGGTAAVGKTAHSLAKILVEIFRKF